VKTLIFESHLFKFQEEEEQKEKQLVLMVLMQMLLLLLLMQLLQLLQLLLQLLLLPLQLLLRLFKVRYTLHIPLIEDEEEEGLLLLDVDFLAEILLNLFVA
jgi:hypothetical protein